MRNYGRIGFVVSSSMKFVSKFSHAHTMILEFFPDNGIIDVFMGKREVVQISILEYNIEHVQLDQIDHHISPRITYDSYSSDLYPTNILAISGRKWCCISILTSSQEDIVPLWVSHHLVREYIKAKSSVEVICSTAILSSMSMRKILIFISVSIHLIDLAVSQHLNKLSHQPFSQLLNVASESSSVDWTLLQLTDQSIVGFI